MPLPPLKNQCPGSMHFASEPGAVTGYNGEYIRCGVCHRKLRLSTNGAVPPHNKPQD